MGHFYRADLLHALLAFLLFFEEFSFTRYITAVALGSHILADGLDSFAGNDFGTDSSLHGNVELLSRN